MTSGRPLRRLLLGLAIPGLALLGYGCAAGVIGGVAGAVLLGGGDSNSSPAVTILDVSSEVVDPSLPLESYSAGDVDITFRLIDAESDSSSVDVEYRRADEEAYRTATPASGSASTRNLSSSPSGETHTFTWDTAADLGAVREVVDVRLQTGRTQARSGAFVVDNTTPPELSLTAVTSAPQGSGPAGEPVLQGDVRIEYTLLDAESSPCGIAVLLEGAGGTIFPAAPAFGEGDGADDLAASPSGTPHVFVWRSIADVPRATSEPRRLIVRAYDTKPGAAVEARVLVNNTTPGLTVFTPQGLQTGNVDLDYIASDENEDPFDVVSVAYSLSGPAGPFRETTEAEGFPSDGRLDLRASVDGVLHRFVWNSAYDLDADLAAGRIQYPATSRALLLLRVRDRATGVEVERPTLEFVLDGEVVATVAGGGGGDGGLATEAILDSPQGIAVDAAGNLYIAEASEEKIRRVDATTGIITTAAGNPDTWVVADGVPATQCGLAWPTGVAVDPAGNLLIADAAGERIRRVSAETGIITTIAGNGTEGYSGDGGPATEAALRNPARAALDAQGNLYIPDGVFEGTMIIDPGNHVVRRVDAATGIIETVAGDGTEGYSGDGGPATAAQLGNPRQVAIDPGGNLYIADAKFHVVRRVDAATGIITTAAGTGTAGFSGDGLPATASRLNEPRSVALDAEGNLYIADRYNHRVRMLDAQTGLLETVAGDGTPAFAGDGGPALDASLREPEDVLIDARGDLWISDRRNHRVRRVDGETGTITTVAGNGNTGFSGDGLQATGAVLNSPGALVRDPDGNIFIADTGNHRIRRADARTGIIATIAGTGVWGFSGDGGPAGLAQMASPQGVALDGAGNLYIGDAGNHCIRSVDGATGIITTIAGIPGDGGFSGDGGPAASARLYRPNQIAFDGAGNLFIADTLNYRIRRIAAATGIITTVAGNGTAGYSGDGGLATAASLEDVGDLVVDAWGNLYFSDTMNHRVRRVNLSTGIITLYAGNGDGGYSGDTGPATSAAVGIPMALALDSGGNLHVAALGVVYHVVGSVFTNTRIRRIDRLSGVITTVAGNGESGTSGDGLTPRQASLDVVTDLEIDELGYFHFSAGMYSSRVRRFWLPPED